jgi:hypothetical protein
MTKPLSSATRCDHIISLIDDCLAELGSGLRLLTGDGQNDARPTRSRNLTVVTG